MGQGLYTAVGFGVIAPPRVLDPDNPRYERDDMPDFVEGRMSSYECNPDYLVVPLAVDDGCLQDWWGLPCLPHDEVAAMVKPRTCKRLAVMPPSLASAATEAAKKWREVQAWYASHGHSLPDGYPVLLSDWH